MICNSFGIDDIQGSALIFYRNVLYCSKGCEDMAKNYLLIYSEILLQVLKKISQALIAVLIPYICLELIKTWLIKYE